jgi:hypothetical protein
MNVEEIGPITNHTLLVTILVEAINYLSPMVTVISAV